MGGNSSPAAVGTLSGIPGASSASMLLPGALEALAAELQAARSSAPAERERVPIGVPRHQKLERSTAAGPNAASAKQTQSEAMRRFLEYAKWATANPGTAAAAWKRNELYEATPMGKAALHDRSSQDLARMSIGEDVARSGATGLREGAEMAAGVFGDSGRGTADVWSHGARSLGLGDGVADFAGYLGRTLSPLGWLPSSEEIRSVTDPLVEAADAQDIFAHEPQSRLGKYARTGGQFLPAAATPGGLLLSASALSRTPIRRSARIFRSTPSHR